MLIRPLAPKLWQADDKNNGGLIPPPEKPEGDNPAASGDEMPDWAKDPAKVMAEIKKLRDEAAQYRTQRNGEREQFEALKKLIDERLPKQETVVDEKDPMKALAARLEAFELQQKTALETAARERMDAIKLKIATEIFGEKVTGENKAQALATLAARLSGENEEALRADATALAALLPAPNPQWQNKTTPASPSGNAVGETSTQRLARIRSGGSAKTSFG